MAEHLEAILDLERAGWRSLCDGTGADFYGSIMTDDARMVLAGGMVMSRDVVVDSLGHAPPWASFDIIDPRLTTVADDVVALVYTGTAHRDDGESFTSVMASVYVQGAEGWKMAHYQQTPTN